MCSSNDDREEVDWDRNLLELANKNANYIVSKGLLDGGSSAENFKLLLHLFNQDRAIKYLEAG